MKKWRQAVAAVLIMMLLPIGGSMAWAEEKGEGFRVVGYYTATSFPNEPLERLQLDKLTHVMYGFLKFTQEGEVLEIAQGEKLAQLVEMAHEKGVKVFVAIGGWSHDGVPLNTRFEKMAGDDAARERFVSGVMEVVRGYGLDGAELDWEYPQENTGYLYDQTVLDLAKALHDEGKELSAAVAGATSIKDRPQSSRLIGKEALEALDFLDIMAYDLKAEQQSPMWFAEQSIAYWKYQGVEKEKLVLGVPLAALPSWMQYRKLVEIDESYAYEDYLAAGTVSKLASGYNGLLTLHDKTVFALENCGGIMLFDINEDREDQYSVLGMMDVLVRERDQIGEKAFAQKVWINVEKRPLTLDKASGEAFIDEKNRVQVPLRVCAESCGAQVVYENGSVVLKQGETVVEFWAGEGKYRVNGAEKLMDTKAVIREGRMYVPMRAAMEPLGYRVEWKASGRCVYVSK